MRLTDSDRNDDYQYVRRYCSDCDADRPCFPIPSKHMGHFLLTVFTLGLWSPGWLAMTLYHRARPYRCMSCGRRTSGQAPRDNEERIIRLPRQD